MIGHRLNSSLTVYRATSSDDGAGGQTRTFASIESGVRAQVSQPSAEERTLAAQNGANLSHVIHVLPGADIQRGDELDIGGARRLRVVAVMSDSRATYLRLECEVTQGG